MSDSAKRRAIYELIQAGAQPAPAEGEHRFYYLRGRGRRVDYLSVDAAGLEQLQSGTLLPALDAEQRLCFVNQETASKVKIFAPRWSLL